MEKEQPFPLKFLSPHNPPSINIELELGAFFAFQVEKSFLLEIIQ